MPLTIQLPSDLEERLCEEADASGMDADAYAREIIERTLRAAGNSASLWEAVPAAEWVRRSRAWSESHREWPVLPPGADDRESLYDGRE